LFWPTLQAEIDIGSFVTFNAKVGGGFFYLFPLWGFALPMVIPEAGIWLRLGKRDDRNRYQLGLGGLSLLATNPGSTGWVDLSSFNNNFVFYFAFKASFNFDLLGKGKD
jgi:hypothetical protein